MAKTYLDRLKRRYKDVVAKGTKAVDILKQVLDKNLSDIQDGVFDNMDSKWKKFVNKFKKKSDIDLSLPSKEDITEIRSVQLIKNQENGRAISQRLKEQLTDELRKAVSKFDEDTIISERGKGRINPRLIDQFEKQITKTFEGYTKKDKKFNMPKNVHTIAVTEIRGSINSMKDRYVQKIIDENPDVEVKKKWIHNIRLSKVPRRGHIQVSKKRAIAYNDFFDVPLYLERQGRLVRVGSHKMRYPHDPTAPITQTANCNCDYDVIVIKRKRK